MDSIQADTTTGTRSSARPNTLPRVAIAHDYLTQRGGAERVVLSLLEAYPDAVVHTTLYDPERTYPQFRDAVIRTSPINRVPAFRADHRRALPVLAWAAGQMRVDAEVTIVSTSGWAHGFDMRGRRLVYCHAPARWLYQTGNYLGAANGNHVRRLAISALREPLLRWDRQAAARADAYLCNSTVVQERIRDAYGIDADVVPPPAGIEAHGDVEPVPALADWATGEPGGYRLVVSRLLPYKNVDRAIDAVRGTGQRLVIVGTGPELDRLRQVAPSGVRFLQGLSDAQMRWTYAHASALIAPSIEDYGLTPLEAGAYGVPTVALHAGGYLDTIADGVNGTFFETTDARHIRDALARADQTAWDQQRVDEHLERFTQPAFISAIRDAVDSLAHTTDQAGR